MSTQVLEQNQAESQAERAAAFAAKESQRTAELANKTAATTPFVSGSGTTSYAVVLQDPGTGFAQLSWSTNNSLNVPVTGPYDWVGVFANSNQAVSNPRSNYLGGIDGYQWASQSSGFTTDVPLVPGLVAAYVVSNSSGEYVTVAVTSPWPPD